MKKILTIALVAILALNGLVFVCQGAQQPAKTGFYPATLRDFSTTGASFGAGVMPYFEDEKGEKYVLIGREVNSRHKREWAFFTGGSEVSTHDKKVMEHPLDCATREFYEEAILGKTLGWDEAAVKKYIKHNTTEVIVKYSRDVRMSRPFILYVVKFPKKDITTIIETFKDVFNDKNLDEKFKEKDALALVKYQDLIDVTKNNQQRVPLTKNLPYWFNKDEENTALMFYMPYYLLRARYAPEVPFTSGKTSSRKYHYVKDTLAPELQNKNYQFFAQEPVAVMRSKL